MFKQRGPRPKTQEQINLQKANFEAVLKMMKAGIPMSKACASLKIQRKYFVKCLSDEQRRLIAEAKAAMAGAGILKTRRSRGL